MVENRPIPIKIPGLTVISPATQGQAANEITINPEKIRQSSGVYDFSIGSTDNDAVQVLIKGLGNFRTSININVNNGRVLVNDIASGSFTTSIFGHRNSFKDAKVILSEINREGQCKDRDQKDQPAYRVRLAMNSKSQDYKLSLHETWSIGFAGTSVTLESDGKGNLTVKKYAVTPVASLNFEQATAYTESRPALKSYPRVISKAAVEAQLQLKSSTRGEA